MRIMTITLTGVLPNRIQALHRFVDPEMGQWNMLDTGDLIPDGAQVSVVDEEFTRCRLLKSVFSPDCQTYTVEIEVPISVDLEHEKQGGQIGEKVANPNALDEGSVIHAGKSLLNELIEALGIFPEDSESLRKSEWPIP